MLGEEGASWRPGALARACGASPWTLSREDLIAAEVSPTHSLPGSPFGAWLRLWLSDRSSVSIRVSSRKDLEQALGRLGLTDRRVGS